MTRTSLILASTALFLASTAAPAQDIRLEKNISVALANEAALAAMQACTEKGYKVSAAVVDRAGQLRAFVRADGAGPHTIDSSRRKAYTSASLREGTSAMLALIQKNPSATNVQMIDNFLILGGGLPITAGDEVIGGIGVGGAPGGHLDDQCAEAGIEKIRERLK